MAITLVSVLTVAAMAACVDGQRARVSNDVPTDTQTGDTAVEGDTADGVLVDSDTSTEVSQPDSVDDTSVVPDVTECRTENDCIPGTPNPCLVYSCVSKTCKETPLSERSCSDGNACTVDDTCQLGVCVPGGELDCARFHDECWVAKSKACDPLIGCDGVAESRGTSCDDDVGHDPGSCVNGWVVPDDRCDGNGMCVDQAARIPAGIHPLAGNWLVVFSNAPTNGTGTTFRGVLSFENSGSVSLTNAVATSAGVLDQLTSSSGTFCTSLSGQTIIELGDQTFITYADKGAEMMTLYGPGDGDPIHGVAIRPSGSSIAPTGTYRLVSTAHYTGRSTPQVMTWQGTVSFTDGCLTDSGVIATTAGLGVSHSYVADGSDCFVSIQGGHRLNLELVPDGTTDPSQTIPVRWTGGIGPRGDVIVLTRDDGAIRYGVLVLVRDRTVGRANLSGPYAFVSMHGGIGSPDQAQVAPRLDAGVIGYQPGAVVNGELFIGGENLGVGPGWWFTPAVGSRYSHRVAFGGRVLEHVGWVSPNDRFIMGWRSVPSTTPNTPGLLSFIPSEGSLFLAIQPTDYTVPEVVTP
jgi:hypothetical protein